MSCCTNAPINEFETKDGSELWPDASPYELALKEIEQLNVDYTELEIERDELKEEIEALRKACSGYWAKGGTEMKDYRVRPRNLRRKT